MKNLNKEKKANPPGEQLTLFAVGSRDCASHSVKPGSKEARQMTVTSGRKCLELSKSVSPLSLLEKMLLGSSIWNSTGRYLTWKKKITKSGYSYWVLWPSKPPIKDNDVGSSEEKKMWRTPSSQEPGIKVDRLVTKDGEQAKVGQRAYDKDTGRLAQIGLPQQVQMWPTPRAALGMGMTLSKGMAKLRHKKYLETEMAYYVGGSGGQLSADWVELLMGFPKGWTAL